jgi:CheY-like chemotaxis protein
VQQVDYDRFRGHATGVGMAKILIVDDEPLITAMLEDWLSELGHAADLRRRRPVHSISNRPPATEDDGSG